MNQNNRSNDKQIEFWNDGPGKDWALYQNGLDQCFANINDHLVGLCQKHSPTRILDVGCGTGATSIALSEAMSGGAEIVGLDVSRPLLNLAEKRIAEHHLDRISFRQADAQTCNFNPDSFDLIASRFGVMFFTDPVKAFSNMRLALAANGRLAFSAWSTVENNPWFSIPRAAAVKQLGKGEPADPRAPGPTAFSDTDYVESILKSAGYQNICISVVSCQIAPDLPLDQIATLACKLGPAVRLLNAKGGSDEDASKIQQSVEQSFSNYIEKGFVSIPASIVFATADST